MFTGKTLDDIYKEKSLRSELYDRFITILTRPLEPRYPFRALPAA